ncbi:MAG: recombinase family protein [Planctomycetota bacterium]
MPPENKQPPQPVICGYARGPAFNELGLLCGSPASRLAVERGLPEIAAARGAEPGEVFVDPAAGALSARWNARPGAREFLSHAKAGDGLLIHELDEIDAYPPYLIRSLRILARKGVRLLILEPSPIELDFATRDTQLFLAGMAEASRMFVERRADHQREILQRRKEAGLAYCGTPQIGKKRVRRQGVLYDIWWPPELELIHEIRARRKRGETFQAIARDFYERKLKTAAGKPWAKRLPRRRSSERFTDARIRNAYRMFAKLLAQGAEFPVLPREKKP